LHVQTKLIPNTSKIQTLDKEWILKEYLCNSCSSSCNGINIIIFNYVLKF
jgi:hypothetical protein